MSTRTSVTPGPHHPRHRQGVPDSLGEAAAADIRAPLQVETFVWSHGYKKIVPDQTDFPHARLQGQRLAEVVLAYCRQHPDARIHLVGHSAGSMVVLSAAEHLPPGTVDC